MTYKTWEMIDPPKSQFEFNCIYNIPFASSVSWETL